MTDEKRPFTVKDHRHFTAEGEARAEGRPDGDERSGRGSSPATSTMNEIAPEPAAPEAPLTFASFLLSLGAQAAMLLEGEKPDFHGARSLISILEMLRDKTEDRRTPEEEQILEGLLYELRLGYLSRAGTDPK